MSYTIKSLHSLQSMKYNLRNNSSNINFNNIEKEASFTTWRKYMFTISFTTTCSSQLLPGVFSSMKKKKKQFSWHFYRVDIIYD